MSVYAKGTFDVELMSAPAELDGAVHRFNFRKMFHGDLQGEGAGLMLSCGDPQTGAAGYVAIETVIGNLGDRYGSFALQQLGMMLAGTQALNYEVVPGSGTGDLQGITGTFHLNIEQDGTHCYELQYDI